MGSVPAPGHAPAVNGVTLRASAYGELPAHRFPVLYPVSSRFGRRPPVWALGFDGLIIVQMTGNELARGTFDTHERPNCRESCCRSRIPLPTP